MLYKEFEKNREDILENEFCMQSNASTLPITDCPSYTPICTIGICIQGNAKIRMDSQEYTIHPHDVFVFMPGLLVSVIETSPHFTTNYFRFLSVRLNRLKNKLLANYLRNRGNDLATVRNSAFCVAILSNNSFICKYNIFFRKYELSVAIL